MQIMMSDRVIKLMYALCVMQYTDLCLYIYSICVYSIYAYYSVQRSIYIMYYYYYYYY